MTVVIRHEIIVTHMCPAIGNRRASYNVTCFHTHVRRLRKSLEIEFINSQIKLKPKGAPNYVRKKRIYGYVSASVAKELNDITLKMVTK